MKLIVIGASGNIGSAILEAAGGKDEIEEIVGVSRRRPTWDPAKTTWVEADLLTADLESLFQGADAVIHLAWAIQPSRQIEYMDRVNIDGSRRVFEAAARAGVPKIVYSSSIGAYAEGPSEDPVSEDWPREQIGESTYGRQKVAVEEILDEFEAAHPEVSVVRIRPGLVFRAEAASEIRRLFAGTLLPGGVLDPSLVPVAPFVSGLRFQAVHSCDVAEAFLAATLKDVSGAFNVAAEPSIGAEELARILDAPPFELPVKPVRALAALSWKLRLQPSEPGWVDLGMGTPLMSTERARRELGWTPRFTATEALEDLLEGLRTGRGHSAPHLRGNAGAGRIDELRTGQGGRQWIRSRSEQIVKYLADCHSIEKQALMQMRYAPSLASRPDLAWPYAEHLGETGEHETIVRERLMELGAEPSSTKDVAGSAGGVGMLAFARFQPDTPGKLAAHAFSYEHMERIAYVILAAYAERNGDRETADAARHIAGQEEAMADRVASLFEEAVSASLERAGSTAEGALPSYLADALAIEGQGETFLGIVPRVVDYPELASVLRQARARSSEQQRAITDALNGSSNPFTKAKSVALRAGGVGIAGFLGAQPDPVTKVAGFTYAFQNLRLGAYSLLERVAELASDERALALAAAGIESARSAADELAALADRLGGV